MTTAASALDAAAEDAAAELDRVAPHLVDGFQRSLGRAADTVGRRLLGALCREDIGDARERYAGRGRRHGFDRVEFPAAAGADPAALLPPLAGELTDAVVNLAVAYARREALDRAIRTAATGTTHQSAAEQGAAQPGADHRSTAQQGAGHRGAAGGATTYGAAAHTTGGHSAATDSATGDGIAATAIHPAGGGPRDLVALYGRLAADQRALRYERLAVDGHNLHPCGRTRLGWRVGDLLAHDLETGYTRVGFVAVRRDALEGDDLGRALAAAYPELPAPPPGYALHPVHEWQLTAALRDRHAALWRDGLLHPVEASLPAAPTAALRTLLPPIGADGRHRYLKLSLDIQITSTRRSISVASARNGPAVSALLHRLLAGEERVLLMAEAAGAAVPATGRDLSAILRAGLDERLRPGEIAVPGGALPARSPVSGRTVLAELVDRYAITRGLRRPDQAALRFVGEYAALLLPPVLRLAARYGVGLEVHLQNCLPTFVDGVPARIALRDFAGLRVHGPRLAAAGIDLPLWPGSVIATGDPDVLRAKVGYTAVQAHLGEIVVTLTGSHGLDERAAWRRVREVLDETYDDMGAGAQDDHRAFTAPVVPHKALVRMRLHGGGDLYVPVRNALHAP
ncbi:IucA/IucC family protein [Rhizomonospora bruguierae]|uniref:IucA/IucC family protein n=1 Tax=Rhizomonospora bruguierae TaxID=1581705 RepID=UPI0020BE1A42|nr:IucA/IucC family protein [Micromonospora sp. NBRC 107566]